jgi:predicted ATPase
LAHRHRIVRVATAPLSLIANGSPRYEFVHELYRAVFYQRQAPARRAKLHRRIGERLEALFAERLNDAAAELANHFERGTDWPRAIKYLRIAADRAAWRHAHREATALLENALCLASKLPNANRATTEAAILERLATIRVASFAIRLVETDAPACRNEPAPGRDHDRFALASRLMECSLAQA